MGRKVRSKVAPIKASAKPCKGCNGTGYYTRWVDTSRDDDMGGATGYYRDYLCSCEAGKERGRLEAERAQINRKLAELDNPRSAK